MDAIVHRAEAKEARRERRDGHDDRGAPERRDTSKGEDWRHDRYEPRDGRESRKTRSPPEEIDLVEIDKQETSAKRIAQAVPSQPGRLNALATEPARPQVKGRGLAMYQPRGKDEETWLRETLEVPAEPARPAPAEPPRAAKEKEKAALEKKLMEMKQELLRKKLLAARAKKGDEKKEDDLVVVKETSAKEKKVAKDKKEKSKDAPEKRGKDEGAKDSALGTSDAKRARYA